MSGRTLLDQIDDLSEDDGDFVPAAKPPKRRRSSSGSSSSSDSDDDTNPLTKKIKTAEDEKVEQEERGRKEEQRKKDLKSIFDVEEEAKAEREAGLLGRVVENDLVEIRRPRLFAWETIHETVRLPRTHPDVLKYGPATSNTQDGVQRPQRDKPDPPSTTAHPLSEPLSILPAESSSTQPRGTASTGTNSTSTSSGPQQPKPKPPLRRKPRQSLESMNAALVAGKGKKMSTIEKSSQDWQAHTTQNTDLAAELAANRRENGGGFLERREFLGRVEERREGVLEGTRRRQ